MPELPEVETIRSDLERLLTGKKIRSVRTLDPTVLTGIGPNGKPRRKVLPAELERNVVGKTLAHFERRGKYLVMEFGDRSALLIHLRMTGQLRVEEPCGKERLIFAFQDSTHLCFRDPRRFGEIKFAPDWKNEKEIRSLGIEPLNGEMSATKLEMLFRGRKAPIHSLLLNQTLVSGLGNIYVTEALFRARIRPFRPAGQIGKRRLDDLARSIREVLSESVRNRGYSMTNYVDAMGRKGRSQLFTLAYGKEGQPCCYCKGSLQRKVLGGRGVVYCSRCQK